MRKTTILDFFTFIQAKYQKHIFVDENTFDLS